MANDKETDHFVITTKVKKGLKREFEFAVKSQSEILGSTRRTRGGNVSVLGNVGLRESSEKLLKVAEREVGVEEEEVGVEENGVGNFGIEDSMKSGIDDPVIDDDRKSEGFSGQDGMLESPVVGGGAAKDNAKAGNQIEDKLLKYYSRMKFKCKVSEAVDAGLVNDENSKSESGPEVAKDDANSNSESGLKVEKDDGNSNSESGLKVEKDDENSNSESGLKVEKDDENSNSESGLKVEKDDGNSSSESGLKVEKDDENSNSESRLKVEKDDENSNSESGLKVEKDDENSNSESGLKVEKDDGLIKTKLSRAPKLLSEFIEAGLFEGLHVQYCRSMKAKSSGNNANIRGMIKGNGILCFCNKCRGTEIVTPRVFESHAFSSNKRPPEYIFLENGKSLRDVMNACKDVPVDAIADIIRRATGLAPQQGEVVIGSIFDSHVRINRLTPSSGMAAIKSADRCTEKPASVERLSVVTSKGSSNKPEGKITQKNLGLHRLVFEENVLPDGTEVTYVANKQVLLTGYKSGSGICCECCNKVISPSQFEAHAGRAAHRKPFHNIYTSNGVSLHELAVMLNKNYNKERDDVCNECRKGGDIIPCGGCPRSFHKDCARTLRKLDGTWYCRHCESNMKESHINANALVAGRVPGVDSIEQIVNRSIRIINTGEVEIGGCILCRDPAFTKEFGPLTVIICEQCEREYHVGCLKEKGMAELEKEPIGDWFCCQDCERIHSSLHKLVAKGEERLPDFLLGAIKNKARSLIDSTIGTKFVVKWGILSGKTVSEENRPLLSAAVTILQENFGHIIDPGTNTDLIPAMVNGEELKIQDFRGMYCAVLTVNSTVVSAGVFRIRGQELAEIPLVATSSQAHGQGYFQSLYACIERFLGFVRVRKIMLPAANGAEEIWTKKFGFSRMTEKELKPFMETYHLMNFQGLPWFQKTVPRVRIIS